MVVSPVVKLVNGNARKLLQDDAVSNGCRNEKILENVVEKVLEGIQSINNNDTKKSDKSMDEKVTQNGNGIHFSARNKTKIVESKKISERNRKFVEKEFITRNSLLTDLLKIDHFKTIYNIFIVILMVMFLTTMLHDYVAQGVINLGLNPIRKGFGNIWVALAVWSCMQIIVFSMYFMYRIWASVKLTRNNFTQKTWNIFWALFLIGFHITLGTFTVKSIINLNIAPACSLALMSELIRFIMKMHAFVRTNAPKSLSENENGKPINPIPSFSNYVYFLFVPTIIYRDAYPRSQKIDWKFVASNIANIIAVIFTISFIFERFLVPNFQNIGKVETTSSQLILAICSCMMPGALTFLVSFFVLLHCWMNIFAELLRFGDRMFYQDWWNCSSFDEYYRKWNVVVHDWLYAYVYRDVCEYVVPGSKVAATLIVFTLSAVVHEFILAFTFGFFYPVLFVLFMGGGVPLVFKRKQAKMFGNILLWLSLCTGNGLILSLYGMEYFARQNCLSDGSFVSLIVPLSWSCGAKVGNV